MATDAEKSQDLKDYLNKKPNPDTSTPLGQFMKDEGIVKVDPKTKDQTWTIQSLTNQYMLTAAFANGVTLAPEYKDDLKKLDNLYGDYQKHQKEAGKESVSKIEFAKEVSEVYKGILNQVSPKSLDFANARLEAANEPGHAVLTMNQYGKISDLMAKNKKEGLSDAEIEQLQGLLKKENPDLKLVTPEEAKRLQKEHGLEKEKGKDDKDDDKGKKRTGQNSSDKMNDMDRVGAELAAMIKEGQHTEALVSKGRDLSQEIASAQAGGNFSTTPGGINNQPAQGISEVRSV